MIGVLGDYCARRGCNRWIAPPAYGIIAGDELLNPYALVGGITMGDEGDGVKLCPSCQEKLSRIISRFLEGR